MSQYCTIFDFFTLLHLLPTLLSFFLFSFILGRQFRSKVKSAFLMLTGTLFIVHLCNFLIYSPFHLIPKNPLHACAEAGFHLLAFFILHLAYTILEKKIDRVYLFFGAAAVGMALSSFFYEFLEWVTLSGGESILQFKLTSVPLLIIASFVPSVYALVLCLNSGKQTITLDQKGALFLLGLGIGLSIVFSMVLIIVIPHFIGYPLGVQGMAIDSFILMIFLYLAVRYHSFLPFEQESLRAASEKLFSNMNEGVILLDENGRAFLMNDTARSLLTPELSEVDAQYLERMLPGYSFSRDLETYEVTATLHEDESTILLSQTPLKEDSRSLGKLLTLYDVSLLRELEREMSRSDRLEALAWLAGGIAHDFNNHLQSIMSAFSILKSSNNLSPGFKEVIDLGETGVKASTTLSNKLLTFSHGGTPLRKAVYLDKTISAAFTGVAIPEGIEYTVNLPSDLSPVFADQSQLEQTLRNLLRNSFQAMPEGGFLSICGKMRQISAIDSSDLTPGEYVEIVIRDTGIGMSSEVCRRAFDPFFSTHPDGAGLGLAMAYSVIRRHEGRISLSSSPGAGCDVTILLPVSPLETEINQQAISSSDSRSGLILLMDDDPVVGKMLGLLLKMAGYDSALTQTGEEALKLYKEALELNTPFLGVITDLTTRQGINGVSLGQALTALDPGCRIIISSGYSHDPVMAKYGEYGFAGMLKKPYTIEELKSVLKEVF